MHAALSYLATLPPQTVVYDGHEYTKGNLAFARHVDPESAAVARLEGLIKAGTIPAERTTIGDEKEWNPFMRLDSPAIQCVLSGSTGDNMGYEAHIVSCAFLGKRPGAESQALR